MTEQMTEHVDLSGKSTRFGVLLAPELLTFSYSLENEMHSEHRSRIPQSDG